MSDYKVSVQGKDLTVKHAVGVEVFPFVSAREAVAAAKWFLAQDGVEAVFPCGWEIRLPADRLPEEIDFEGQLYGFCGGLVVGTARGWHGLCGHSHVSGAQYYEEDEVRAYREAGHPVDPDAFLMDGRSVQAVR